MTRVRLQNPGWRRIVASAASLALAALLLVLVMPWAAGTHWDVALQALGGLGWAEVVLMTALWAAGLSLYTYVYTCSLPGLSHTKALALNLTGSLVSNVLPFGGAAGVATTYGLTRSWGYPNDATSLMVLVSGLANLGIRLVLALGGLAAALATGAVLPAGIQRGLIVTITVLGLAVAVLVATLASSRFAGAADNALDVATAWVRRIAGGSPQRAGARRWFAVLQQRSRSVLASGWPGITAGMVGYYVTEALMLGVALRALGSDLGWTGVVAAFALSRVLTAAVITPSGTGVSEAGTAALLVFLGVPAPAAAAAVLVLYFYTYLIEIPAGLAGWAWVVAMRKRWGGASAGQALQPLPTSDSQPWGNVAGPGG